MKIKYNKMRTRQNCRGRASKKYYEIALQNVSKKALRELGKKFSSRGYYNESNECIIFEIAQIKFQRILGEICSIAGVKEEDVPEAGYVEFGSAELAVECL
jgi:hypothetical protein